MINASVVAVSSNPAHTFSKLNRESLELVTGLGVKGDAHNGKTVQHLFRIRQNPDQINLRQVRLIHAELLEAVAADGFNVAPGELGENITTRGIDLLSLPVGTKLQIGEAALIEITGLRNPCYQIDDFQRGLLKEMVEKNEQGQVVRKAGVMGIVLLGGLVRPNDPIKVIFPALPHQRLQVV